MLDTLAEAWAADHGGANIWANKAVRFLDPCTKSGVFLREITRRLTEGLVDQIPDLQARVEHILTKQVFGVGITQITALLARRSVYCSRHAQGKHSIGKGFTRDDGHIWFKRLEHSWQGNKCRFCGAPKEIFERGDNLETHAYAFIHTADIQERIKDFFGEQMQFDVVIGNPPYQLKGGAGGSSDSSIYHLFVEQAIKLEPTYAIFVTPSRWLAGGRGLDEFRTKMLTGGHLRALADFADSSEAFPGVQLKGGVCYFLWDGRYVGTCDVTRMAGGTATLQVNRQLDEFDVFVRDERALSILRKVLSFEEASVVELLSGDTPFGIATNFEHWSAKREPESIELHLIKNGKRTVGYVDRREVRKNSQAIDSWKVLVPEAYGAGESSPHQILGKEIVARPPSACTQSYLTVSTFETENAAKSFASYYRTRLFRFLVSLRKITQHALRSTYAWVPQQAWDVGWTDELLCEKYGITKEEQSYIASVVRPMSPDLFEDLLND